MIKHEFKICPRCDGEFECKTGSISICQCQTVSLNVMQSEYIAERYDECLCAACLEELRSDYNIGRFESRIAQFLTGHH